MKYANLSRMPQATWIPKTLSKGKTARVLREEIKTGQNVDCAQFYGKKRYRKIRNPPCVLQGNGPLGPLPKKEGRKEGRKKMIEQKKERTKERQSKRTETGK